MAKRIQEASSMTPVLLVEVSDVYSRQRAAFPRISRTTSITGSTMATGSLTRQI